ncbi:MAG: DUF3365 domain-containing protein [Planctomycetota bacterium]|nr:MAG: DUF3365 domain-containing protein [Planctomycetota bacterium]
MEGAVGGEREIAPASEVGVDEEGRGELRYLQPLVMGELCLKCHGPVEGIDPGVRAVLAERYAEDEAVGFALGELRGGGECAGGVGVRGVGAGRRVTWLRPLGGTKIAKPILVARAWEVETGDRGGLPPPSLFESKAGTGVSRRMHQDRRADLGGTRILVGRVGGVMSRHRGGPPLPSLFESKAGTGRFGMASPD